MPEAPHCFPLGTRIVALVGIPEEETVRTFIIIELRFLPIFAGGHMPRHDVGVEFARSSLSDSPEEARLDLNHSLGPTVGIRAQMIEESLPDPGLQIETGEMVFRLIRERDRGDGQAATELLPHSIHRFAKLPHVKGHEFRAEIEHALVLFVQISWILAVTLLKSLVEWILVENEREPIAGR